LKTNLILRVVYFLKKLINFMKKFMRKKIFYVVSILIIIGALVWVGCVYFWPQYKFQKFLESYKALEQGLVSMLKNDTFGGQTPEETYNLYIAALRKGDTDLASQYFYWERQVGEKQRLDEMKTKGELDKYIADLPKWAEMKEEAYGSADGKRYSWLEKLVETTSVKVPDGAGGFIEHIFKPGEYKQEIDFWLNKQANIWKIYSL